MRNLAIRMNLVILAALLATCGPTAREQAIKAAFITTNTAADAFRAYSAKHEGTLIDNAKTLVEGETELAAFRATKAKIELLLEDAYKTIAAAAIINADPKSLDNLKTAGALLASELTKFIQGGAI